MTLVARLIWWVVRLRGGTLARSQLASSHMTPSSALRIACYEYVCQIESSRPSPTNSLEYPLLGLPRNPED